MTQAFNLNAEEKKMRSRKYVLQLVPNWHYNISWPGYFAGLGYVGDPHKAVHFVSKRQASQIAMGHPLGQNGCFKIVNLSDAEAV